MSNCAVVDCREIVTKKGHRFCYEHWQADQNGQLSTCEACLGLKQSDKPLCYPCFKRRSGGGESAAQLDSKPLSATALGEVFGVSAQRINLIFQELGWTRKEPAGGWSVTPQGARAGGSSKEARQTGMPYVVWDSGVQHNRSLLEAMGLYGGEEPAVIVEPPPASRGVADAVVAPPTTNPRDAYPAAYRTNDGHRVRSRAEQMIDDWLYWHGVVHAYERKVPIEEDMLCDFWLPRGRVYIEFWGMESDAQYAERKRKKKSIYEKHLLQLIELGDTELTSLDDHLPRLLRKYGVSVD